jgi:hypothetical protein
MLCATQTQTILTALIDSLRHSSLTPPTMRQRLTHTICTGFSAKLLVSVFSQVQRRDTVTQYYRLRVIRP